MGDSQKPISMNARLLSVGVVALTVIAVVLVWQFVVRPMTTRDSVGSTSKGAATSPPPTAAKDDPWIGKWQDINYPTESFELRADGRMQWGDDPKSVSSYVTDSDGGIIAQMGKGVAVQFKRRDKDTLSMLAPNGGYTEPPADFRRIQGP